MLTDRFFVSRSTAEQQRSGTRESSWSLYASAGPLTPPRNGQTGVSLYDRHQANYHILRGWVKLNCITCFYNLYLSIRYWSSVCGLCRLFGSRHPHCQPFCGTEPKRPSLSSPATGEIRSTPLPFLSFSLLLFFLKSPSSCSVFPTGVRQVAHQIICSWSVATFVALWTRSNIFLTRDFTHKEVQLRLSDRACVTFSVDAPLEYSVYYLAFVSIDIPSVKSANFFIKNLFPLAVLPQSRIKVYGFCNCVFFVTVIKKHW